MRYIIVFLLFSVFQSTAQDSDVSDQKAIDKLESIYINYKSYDTHKYEFDMTIQYPEREGETISGSLIEDGNRFSLDTKERQIISDAMTVWVFHKERNEVEINDAEEDEDSGFLTPADVFELYKSDEYIFAISNYLFENGQNCTQIECKPKNRSSEYGKIRLTLGDKSKSILKAQVFYKDGTRIKMDLNNHVKGFVITPTTFKFDPADHDGVHVEDLRF